MTEAYQSAITNALTSFSNKPLAITGKSVDSINSVINSGDREGEVPVMMNVSDVEIFKDRYTTLDAFLAREDGSDLAYLRILRFKKGMFGSQVFPTTGVYQDFIVTNLSSGSTEKAQILKTNKTLQVYSFDSQPEMLNIQGVLKSTTQCNWDMAMVILWDNLLRLSQLTEHDLIVEFGYQGNTYWGYPLSFQWQKSSNMQMLASYAMQFLIVKRAIIAKSAIQITLAENLNTQIQKIPSIL